MDTFVVDSVCPSATAFACASSSDLVTVLARVRNSAAAAAISLRDKKLKPRRNLSTRDWPPKRDAGPLALVRGRSPGLWSLQPNHVRKREALIKVASTKPIFWLSAKRPCVHNVHVCQTFHTTGNNHWAYQWLLPMNRCMFVNVPRLLLAHSGRLPPDSKAHQRIAFVKRQTLFVPLHTPAERVCFSQCYNVKCDCIAFE